MKKLTLVSFWYAGKYHSHFVMAKYDDKGHAQISTQAQSTLLSKSGLTHKCVGFK